MKKIFTLIVLLYFSSSVFAQSPPACQYDYTWLALGKTGVWPDSATNFSPGLVGNAYTQHVTIKVPKDTSASIFGGAPQTFTFDRIELSNPTGYTNYGLPPGLNLSCTPASCKFPGNDTSCLVIYGTPTTAGTYQLGFKLTSYVKELANIAVQSSTLTYYKIIITNPNSIAVHNSPGFEVYECSPNPSSQNAYIRYVLAHDTKVKLCLYNSIGKLVYEKRETGTKGENKLELNTENLAAGVYLYSFECNGNSITKRMIIAKD